MSTDSHGAMAAELADERQRCARLRAELKYAAHILDHWVTTHGRFHPEDASPTDDFTREGIETVAACRAALVRGAGAGEPQTIPEAARLHGLFARVYDLCNDPHPLPDREVRLACFEIAAEALRP